MNKKLKTMVLAGFLPLCGFATMNDDDATKLETQEIKLSSIEDALDDKTHAVPATANLTGSLLNVNFTGTIPLATVAVTNTTTGITTSTSLPTVSGVTFTTPVTLGTNIVTVTNEQSGESVSGEFEVEEEE